jgi:hypothetical protein
MECLQAQFVDWKISGAVTRYAIESQQFDDLSCKVTKEVVSLDLTKKEFRGMMEGTRNETPSHFHHVTDKCSWTRSTPISTGFSRRNRKIHQRRTLRSGHSRTAFGSSRCTEYI